MTQFLINIFICGSKLNLPSRLCLHFHNNLSKLDDHAVDVHQYAVTFMMPKYILDKYILTHSSPLQYTCTIEKKSAPSRTLNTIYEWNKNKLLHILSTYSGKVSRNNVGIISS